MPRVLVTRAAHQSSALAAALSALGLETILIPTLEIAPPEDLAPLDAALAVLPTFHWLVFTSANAVEALAHRRTPSRSFRAVDSEDPRIAAIGPATARAVQQLLGLPPDLIPPTAIAESLLATLLPHALQPNGTPTRFLLPQAEDARKLLETGLKAAGSEVTALAVYRKRLPEGAIAQLQTLFTTAPPDAVTFTSSSTVTHLLALLEAASLTLPAQVCRISIGPITSQTLREAGLPPHAESLQPTVQSLAETVLQTLRSGAGS